MDKIDELLTRIVANIIPGKAQLEQILRSGRKLNVYFGIDPTFTRIHLGNAVPLRKLQAFVEAGHNVTFLIGDFTALIGDTSDKNSERPVLTYDQIQANFESYKQQASKIVDFSKVSVRHNHEWLKKLGFEDVVKLTRHFSLNDFISRELIKKRLTEGNSVSLPEVLYPVMQGYDSYFMDTDIQIGGTDQTFNMQAGRTLQKQLRGKESFIVVTQFPLTGTDGRKMSKSWGNAIWLDDSTNDMFGKVMAVRDDLIDQYFLLATNLPQDQFPKDKQPMERKKKLAWQIVSELHSPTAADQAQKEFENTFQQGQTPTDVPSYHLKQNRQLVEVLVATQLAKSKSEARRLILQRGVKINQMVADNGEVEVGSGDLIQVGSRKFVKIVSS